MSERENGSVLIEAIIAVAIVSMMLVVMYKSVSQSVTGAHRVAEKRQALLVAQSEMDAVGSVLPLRPGSVSGTEGSFVWQLDIAPYPAAGGPSKSGPLYQVTVSVRGHDSGVDLITLRTLQIGSTS
jgi:type II secretory pathway pseudopilin PulG